MPSFNVGVLGATGAVGQKFIRLLRNHPWFTIHALGASERSAGKKYIDAANWIEPIQLPDFVAKKTVRSCKPEKFDDVDFVFSGLDSSVAGDIEKAFASAGIPVISNAKNYRMDDTVPLLIPEVNPDHIAMIENQTFSSDGSGWIVTNPNCVSIPLTMSLKPLFDAYGIDGVILTSLQAVSGAGYPGVASLDILGNVIPNIGGEEPKVETESLKLLGDLDDAGKVTFQDFPISATTTRVPTINGHLLSVTVDLADAPSSIDDVVDAFENWKSPIADLELPSAPEFPVKVHTNDFYPQPRFHSMEEGGMQAGVGRIRKAKIFDVSYVALAHNTIRGAAGGAILNAELLVSKGKIG